jgi:serpin B
MFRNIFIALIALSFSLTHAQNIDISVTAPVPRLIEDNNAFALSLYPALDHAKANLVYSPYSIFSCLSMVSMGAKDQTYEQMKAALHLSFNRHDLAQAFSELTQKWDDPRLKIANAVWANQDTYFLPEFLETLQNDFNALAYSLNFLQPEKSAIIINEWVDNQTDGKIPELLKPLDLSPQTRMVLTNTIYFKGSWRFPFSTNLTHPQPFYITEEKSFDVDMMHQLGSFTYTEDEDFQVLSLPFENVEESHNRLACLFLVPKNNHSLEISSQGVEKYMKNLLHRRVNISLPKFTLRQRFDLGDTLKRLGMINPFSSKANFSLINGMHDLCLSKVVHEAYFALDESGVTAAAATAATMNTTTSKPLNPPVTFTADHPFLFFLVDLESKAILFLGKVQQPQAHESI